MFCSYSSRSEHSVTMNSSRVKPKPGRPYQKCGFKISRSCYKSILAVWAIQTITCKSSLKQLLQVTQLRCCVIVKAHNVTQLRFLVHVQKTCVYTATKDNTHRHCTAEEIASKDLTLSCTSNYQSAITH